MFFAKIRVKRSKRRYLKYNTIGKQLWKIGKNEYCLYFSFNRKIRIYICTFCAMMCHKQVIYLNFRALVVIYGTYRATSYLYFDYLYSS